MKFLRKISIVSLLFASTILMADRGGFGAGFGTGFAVGAIGTAIASRPAERVEYRYYDTDDSNYYYTRQDEEIARLREENRRLRQQRLNARNNG